MGRVETGVIKVRARPHALWTILRSDLNCKHLLAIAEVLGGSGNLQRALWLLQGMHCMVSSVNEC